MKKSIILIAVFVFVLVTVSWSAVPHRHSYENIPLSINSSWRISDSIYKSPYTHYPDSDIPTGSSIWLDLEITNNSNKTIDNIRAYGNSYIYEQDGKLSFSSITHSGMNLLWDTNLWDMAIIYSSGNSSYPSSTLRGKETRTVSLFVANAFDTDMWSAEEYIKSFYNRIEADLYITWIHYTGFGGQWGHAFGITQWERAIEWVSNDSYIVGENRPVNAVKIDIEPFQR